MRVSVYSVGGYHPRTGDFAYSNYGGFFSKQLAEDWSRKQGHGWQYKEIVENRVEATPLQPGLARGALVYWTTFGGDRFFGWIREYDNGTAIVWTGTGDKAVRVS